MNFNEELAVAGVLELTDSELETAHGAWGEFSEPEYEYIWPYGWVLVEPNYFGGWDRGGWDRGRRDGGGRDDGRRDGGGHDDGRRGR